MKTMIVTLALMASLFVQAAGETVKLGQPAWDQYLAAQTALAADNWVDAQKALKALASLATGPVKAAATTAANAAEIKAARLAFKPLSELLKDAELPAGSSLAFCPMVDNNKGGHWVQKNGELRNPYFGSAMLKCGEIKKKAKQN